MSSVSEARPGLFKRLMSPLVDPAVFDFWAGMFNRTWTWDRPLARIVARHAASSDAVTLVLAPNRHWRGFVPGQHLNVGAELNGRLIQRSYSLSDMPRRDGRLSITVKRVSGGLLSNHLCEQAKVGDVLSLGQAFGELQIQPAAPAVLLAAGSGITPMMSLLRAWAAAGPRQSLTLLYWARTRSQLCFASELEALAQQQSLFKLHLLVTQEGPASAERIHAAQLARLLGQGGELAASQVLACGPGGFVKTARELLAGQVARFQAEAFSPAPVADAASTGQRVTLQLRRSGKELSVSADQPILVSLEAAGLRPAHGCRMGVCHSCVCTKLDGQAINIDTGERDTEPGSALRICVSRPATDLSLDL